MLQLSASTSASSSNPYRAPPFQQPSPREASSLHTRVRLPGSTAQELQPKKFLGQDYRWKEERKGEENDGEDRLSPSYRVNHESLAALNMASTSSSLESHKEIVVDEFTSSWHHFSESSVRMPIIPKAPPLPFPKIFFDNVSERYRNALSLEQQDPARAAILYDKMIRDADSVEKGMNMPSHLYTTPPDYPEGRHDIDRAMFRLALLYKNGAAGVDKDLKKAFYLLSRLANFHAEARFLLAKCYEKGRGVAEDVDKARHQYEMMASWYEPAASLMKAIEDLEAHVEKLYKRGLAYEKTNPLQAVELYEHIIKIAVHPSNRLLRYTNKSPNEWQRDYPYPHDGRNDVDRAIFRLALLYKEGAQGVEQNSKRSFELLLQLKQSHKEAVYLLAQCYEKGLGVEACRFNASHYYAMIKNWYDKPMPQFDKSNRMIV